MQISLCPMSAESFESFRDDSVQSFAQELIKIKGLTQEEALLEVRIWEERGHRLGRKPDRIWEA